MSPRIAFIPYTAPKIDAEETTCAKRRSVYMANVGRASHSEAATAKTKQPRISSGLFVTF
jgi:hypothetical protein